MCLPWPRWCGHTTRSARRRNCAIRSTSARSTWAPRVAIRNSATAWCRPRRRSTASISAAAATEPAASEARARGGLSQISPPLRSHFILLPERPRHPLALHQRHDLLPVENAAPRRPCVVLRRHRLDALGLPRREVVELGPVGVHVVELPRARVALDELP